MENYSTLCLNLNASNYLMSVTKWSKFLSIVMFISCSIMLLTGIGLLIFNSTIPMMNGMKTETMIPIKIISTLYIILSGLYFFIGFFMYRFAIKTANAINLQMESELEVGFKALKNQYTLMGVITIVIISLTILAFVGGIIVILTSATNL